MASIDVTPNPCLVDDALHIRMGALRPWQEVTLRAQICEDGDRFYSYAHYKANRNGAVDLQSMPAQGGSYLGVEPVGLLWSMVQEPGQKPGRRLLKSNVTAPIITRLTLLDGFLEADAVLDPSRFTLLAVGSCDRFYRRPDVERIEIREGRLRGTLFVPPGDGPFPGVLDLFGTIGGTVEHRAALMASRGLVALALSYFTPGKGEGLIADLEYFEAGVDLLLRHEKVRKPHVGVMGVSKGAEIAMLLPVVCHKIKASVEINGIYVNTLVDHTYHGEIFPCHYLEESDMVWTNEGVSFSRCYEVLPNADTCAFPVERANCEYLLIHGADDRSVKPDTAKYVPARLKDHGKSNVEVLVYPGTGHLVEPPHSPHFYSSYHGLFKNVAVWGGDPRLHARAQEDAWEQSLNFLKRHLGANEGVKDQKPDSFNTMDISKL